MDNLCKALIKDEYGGKYECLNEATKEITIDTFASHLGKRVKRVRRLCNEHSKRLLSRHRYQIKHMNKDCILTVKEIEPVAPQLSIQ